MGLSLNFRRVCVFIRYHVEYVDKLTAHNKIQFTESNVQPNLFLVWVETKETVVLEYAIFSPPHLSDLMGFEVLGNPFKSFDLICVCFCSCVQKHPHRIGKHARAITSNGNCFVIIIIVFILPYVLCVCVAVDFPDLISFFGNYCSCLPALFIVKMLKTCATVRSLLMVIPFGFLQHFTSPELLFLLERLM